MTPDSPLVALQAIIADLQADPGDHRRSPRWNQALGLLKKTDASQKTVVNIVAGRNLEALSELVDELINPRDDSADPEIDPHEMRLAMRAFRERLKLVKLDHESKLGRSPLTSGKSAEIDAILAPREFHDDVWQTLVRTGKLRDVGGGFYQLVEK